MMHLFSWLRQLSGCVVAASILGSASYVGSSLGVADSDSRILPWAGSGGGNEVGSEPGEAEVSKGEMEQGSHRGREAGRWKEGQGEARNRGILLVSDFGFGRGLEEWCAFVSGLQDEKSTKLNSNLVSCQPDSGWHETSARI